MAIEHAIAHLDDDDDDETTFFAREPWTPASPCVALRPDDEPEAIAQAKSAGYAYFLEACVAREATGVFELRK